MSDENYSRLFDLVENAYHNSTYTLKNRRTGFGRISENQKFFWIRIPKNASEFVTYHTPEMREIDFNFDHDLITDESYTSCVILRNPLDRWIRDASTFLLDTHEELDIDIVDSYSVLVDSGVLKKILIEYLIENLSTDPNLCPQAWFLYPCNLKKIDFFIVNDKLGQQLNKYFRYRGIPTLMNNQKINESPITPISSLLKEFFFDDANMVYKQKVLDSLKLDYELLSLINYYNS